MEGPYNHITKYVCFVLDFHNENSFSKKKSITTKIRALWCIWAIRVRNSKWYKEAQVWDIQHENNYKKKGSNKPNYASKFLLRYSLKIKNLSPNRETEKWQIGNNIISTQWSPGISTLRPVIFNCLLWNWSMPLGWISNYIHHKVCG